jgi:uncharacterized membrane protein YedE/YeeE
MPPLAALISGLLFGIGLILGGMTQPKNVIAFLDVAGDWDPGLAFVMIGAIAVYAPLYRKLITGTVPLYAQAFSRAVQGTLDAPLLAGAAVFGVGWGLAGFCPGPAIVSAGSGAALGVTFLLSMLAGMGGFELYRRVTQRG